MLNENGEVIECRLQSPGHARLRGTQAALRHFAGVVPNRLWLANTDADTLVPVDWLTRHLSFADRGSAAVAGIVKVEAVPGLDTTEMASLMSHYTLADDGTHTHVHGANFGVRADAYRHAGGWKPISVGEDHCLWNRIR
jgi:cellulose synthase/poly-beta-1,6-N-acetylglucosamine synthase-like glycosyltransferase